MGTYPKSKFPDSSHRPNFHIAISKVDSLRSAKLSLFCTWLLFLWMLLRFPITDFKQLDYDVPWCGFLYVCEFGKFLYHFFKYVFFFFVATLSPLSETQITLTLSLEFSHSSLTLFIWGGVSFFSLFHFGKFPSVYIKVH